MKSSEMQIKIQNVVASVTTSHDLDLSAIVRAFPHVEYKPMVFPGLCFRLKNPKTATLIFNSGKMVCTGAKSVKLARKAVNKVVKELKSNGIMVLGKPEIQVQNIVASANLGGEIDLEKTVYVLRRIMYEPEQFPGAVYRMNEPKVVFLIFSNGKLVITGAKREEDVSQAVTTLHNKLVKENLMT